MATEYDLGSVVGPQGSTGPQGVSITNAAINSEGHLIVTLSNSNRIDTGYVVGPAGPTGASGKSAYDQAMEGGYAGTEIEFNTAIANLSPMKLVLQYAHTRTGTTHELNGPEGASTISFTATAPYTDGDTYKLNDTVVTAATVDGAALHTGDFVTGQKIIVTINGNKLTFPWRSYETRISAIDAEMQNKANVEDHQLKTYMSLKQIGITVGEETFDGIARAMPDGSRLTFSVNTTDNADIYPYPYGVCTVTRVSQARILFEFADNNGSRRWNGAYYYTSNPTFAGWVQIASATPPQEFNLPLAEGLVDGGGGGFSHYWKTQENVVGFTFSAVATKSIVSSTTVATFPYGFRPDATKIFNASLLSKGIRYGGNSINVTGDGRLLYYGQEITSETIVFCSGVFVAVI